MNDILTSRRAVPATREHDDLPSLQDQLTYARAISEATAMLPEAYRKQPGAVLLAQEWARSRGVDLLTTLQTVAFISGKPVIDATMQRALAKRAGYDVRPVGAITDTAATVRITGNGVDEEVTFTWEDAIQAKLVKENGAYTKNPKNMMVARATANAMRWYAPEVMVGLALEDELEDELDEMLPTATATVDPEPVVEGEARQEVEGRTTVEEQIAAAEAEPVDAEVVETKATPATKGKAAAGIESVRSFHMYQQLVEAMNAEGIPIAKTSWTQAQATRVIILCDQLIAQAQAQEPEGAGS